MTADEPAAPPSTVLESLDAALCGSACGTPAGSYGGSEFLLWQVRSTPVAAPLVTTANFADPLPGAIGQPGTRVVLGGCPLNAGVQAGGRTFVGYRNELGYGVEVGYLFSDASLNQSVSTTGLPGAPNLAVPVFDPSGVSGLGGIPGQTIFVLPGPFPGALVGSAAAQVPAFRGAFHLGYSNRFQGAEVNGTARLGDWGGLRVDGLAGFRWFQLNETLTYTVATIGVPGSAVAGAFVNATDQFEARNNFFGGQLGVRAAYELGRLSVSAAGKVALGDARQGATVRGTARASNGNLFFLTNNTAGQVLPTGVFAQPSNSGSYSRDVFAALPEATVNVGYHLTRHVRVFAGYNFLFISNVLRPGDLIDPSVNTSRTGLADASRATVGTGAGPIPFGSPGPAPTATGPLAPAFRFTATDVWVQGVNFGLTANY
ncbi:BBP7 family outer membrane beta-barrel protein [Gemmata sp.]|uniref:BBP7 family outer membrane beta-barrel protein n=1 Tax=Gemmata sp. TaxID=1914242 RepID=UPI003F70A03C